MEKIDMQMLLRRPIQPELCMNTIDSMEVNIRSDIRRSTTTFLKASLTTSLTVLVCATEFKEEK